MFRQFFEWASSRRHPSSDGPIVERTIAQGLHAPLPTKEQIEKYLPKVLEDPNFKEAISSLPLFSVRTEKKVPREDFEARCDAITSAFAVPAYCRDPKYNFILARIRELVDMSPGSKVAVAETADLLECLVTYQQVAYTKEIFLNEQNLWLPWKNGTRSVTIFATNTAENAPLRATEPERLRIFPHGPRLFMKLKSKDLLNQATEGKSYRVGVFHGASGSGKTSAMLTAAVEVFGAAIVIHFHGENLASAIATSGKGMQSPGPRNDTVHDELLKLILNVESIRSALRRNLQPSNATVAVILDEMGSHRSIVRAVCAERLKIAQSIQTSLGVAKVVLLCGGTGVDTSPDGASTDIASIQNNYFVVSDFGVVRTDWCQWLTKDNGAAGKHVKEWLEGNNTHLSRLANDLLTNCRSAALLVQSLLEAVSSLCSDCDPVKSPLTIEHLIPNDLFQCILCTISQFKGLNGLNTVSFVRAAELIREAVALEMCAVKVGLDSVGRRLLTHYGILTDTWAGLSEEAKGAHAKDLGVPRYRVSRALVTMGRLGLGRCTSRPDATPWSSWEDDICQYFATLARSAMMMKKQQDMDSSVTLLLPPKPRGFQYADDATLRAMQRAQLHLQCIPMIPKEWNFQRDRKPQAFCSRSLAVQLQPSVPTGVLDAIVKDIEASLKECDFLVLRNAPLAHYADVICVNNLSKELWLIQCKYSASPKWMKVDWRAELQKMGHEGPSEAAAFTANLTKRLGLMGQRFFFCLAHTKACRCTPEQPADLSAHNVHVLEHPGFNFGVLLGPTFDRDLTSWVEADMWERNQPDEAGAAGARKGHKRSRVEE